MISYQVVALRGIREERVASQLSATQATNMRRLLVALQTDGDQTEFVIRAGTGFERIALAMRKTS